MINRELRRRLLTIAVAVAVVLVFAAPAWSECDSTAKGEKYEKGEWTVRTSMMTSPLFTEMDIHHAQILCKLGNYQMQNGEYETAVASFRRSAMILEDTLGNYHNGTSVLSDPANCIEQGKDILAKYEAPGNESYEVAAGIEGNNPDYVGQHRDKPEADSSTNEDRRIDERVEMNPGLDLPWFKPEDTDAKMEGTENVCPDAMNLGSIANELFTTKDYQEALVAVAAAACNLEKCMPAITSAK